MRPYAGMAAIVAALSLSCCSADSEPAREHVHTVTATATPSVMPTIADRALVREFVAFARDPESVPMPPFAPTVRLGLGAEAAGRVRSPSLRDPEAWVIERVFAGGMGPFSALATLASSRRIPLTVMIGDQPHCASERPVIVAELRDLRHISIEPRKDAIDSCLSWFSVGLYVDAAGRIAAVTLDLWEP